MTHPARKRSLAGPVIVLIAGLVAVVFALGFTLGPTTQQGASASVPTPSPTASAPHTPKPTPSPTPTGCDPAYKQVAVGHSGGKVDDGFKTFVAKLIAQGGLTSAQIDSIVQYAGQRASDLASWAHPMGLIDDPNKWQPLVQNGCLSTDGQKLLYKFEGVLQSTNTKLALSEAPANGYNSGVANGTYGVETVQGVSGDRTAIQITLANGTTFWIMERCGNPVFQGKPNLPSVPSTFVPPPPPPPAPPPSSPPHVPSCTYDCAKDPKLSVTPVPGANRQPNDSYEPPASVSKPSNPAPVQSAGSTPTSTSQAPGATAPNPNRTTSSPGTGTTPSGGSGSVNSTPTTGSGSGGNSTPIPAPSW